MKKIIILMLCMFLLVGTVSAFEFDNIKGYDEETKTVTVNNCAVWTGFCLIKGDKIAEIKLNTPLNYQVHRGYNKVAEFTITSFQDYNNALKELELYDKTKGMQKFTREFDYKYRSYEDVEVDDYEWVIVEKQGNETETKEYTKTGSHIETQEVWTKLTPANFKKNDVLTIGIFTDVKKGDKVEWIPNFFGIRADEWAVWTEDLNTNLLAYYTFDDDITDVTGNGHTCSGNADQIGSGGIIGGELNFDGTEYLHCEGFSSEITEDFTIVYWFDMDSLSPFDALTGIYASNVSWSGTKILMGAWATNQLGFNLYTTAGTQDGSSPATGQTHIGTGWDFIALTYDGSNATQWDNGAIAKSISASGTFTYTGSPLLFMGSRFDNGAYNYTGSFDEYAVWNRSLTDSEISDLYNGGTGIQYIGNYPPSVTLNVPNTNQTSNNVIFNWSVSDDVQVDNSTLYINDIINQTIIHGASNYTSEQVSLTLGDGNYNWSVQAYDDTGESNTSTYNYFSIDSTLPTVQIYYPDGSSITDLISSTKDFNFTVSDTNLDTCWYQYNGVNTTIADCTINSTFVLKTSQNIILWANDTFGNQNSNSVTWTGTTFIRINSQDINGNSISPVGVQIPLINIDKSTSQIEITNLTFFDTSDPYEVNISIQDLSSKNVNIINQSLILNSSIGEYNITLQPKRFMIYFVNTSYRDNITNSATNTTAKILNVNQSITTTLNLLDFPLTNLSEGTTEMRFNMMNNTNYSSGQVYEFLNTATTFVNETMMVLDTVNREVAIQIKDTDRRNQQGVTVRLSCIKAEPTFTGFALIGQKITNTEGIAYIPLDDTEDLTDGAMNFDCLITVLSPTHKRRSVFFTPHSWDYDLKKIIAVETSTIKPKNGIRLGLTKYTWTNQTSIIGGTYYYETDSKMGYTTTYNRLNGDPLSFPTEDAFGYKRFTITKDINWDASTTDSIILETWLYDEIYEGFRLVRNDTLPYVKRVEIFNIVHITDTVYGKVIVLILLIVASMVMSWTTSSPNAGFYTFIYGLLFIGFLLTGNAIFWLMTIAGTYYALSLIKRWRTN